MKSGKWIWGSTLLWALVSWLLFSATANATDQSTQVWLDYNPSWALSPEVTVGGDVGFRKVLGSHEWARLVLRPGVDVPVKFFTLKAGLGNFFTFSDYITNRWEIRPYQGVGWVWPRIGVNFDHLARLEERFEFNTETWNSTNSLRGRYRLRARYQFATIRPGRFWRAYGSGEFFRILTGAAGTQREQFRVTLGIERCFSPGSRVRLQVTWQQEELFFLPSDSAEEIYFRLRFFQNF